MVCQQTPKKQILQKQWGVQASLKMQKESGNIIVGSILKVAKFLSNNPYGM